MKSVIVHLVLGVCVAGLVRADQTTQSVQQALKNQGFYYGNVTGDKSAETTAAIRRYQIRNALQVTGEVNPETLSSLKLNSNSVASSQSASKPAVTQSNTTPPDNSSRVRPNSPAPSSPTEQDRRPEATSAFSGARYQPLPPRMNSRMMVAEAQRQLISRGYYQGRIDGRYGRRMTLAMRAFQSQSGLPPTGHLDTSTLDALGISRENLASVESAPRAYEMWVPVTKFKHGSWKVKWKKVHRDDRYEMGDENRQENAAVWSNGQDRDE